MRISSRECPWCDELGAVAPASRPGAPWSAHWSVHVTRRFSGWSVPAGQYDARARFTSPSPPGPEAAQGVRPLRARVARTRPPPPPPGTEADCGFAPPAAALRQTAPPAAPAAPAAGAEDPRAAPVPGGGGGG